MIRKTLAQWLTWQEQLHPSEIELGLERVKSVASRLALKQIRTITVGGTNGKGSCVAYLEAILLAAGYKVGAYSSPHLLRYNERVRINGDMVSDQALCDSFERIDNARMNNARMDSARTSTSLTYFEFGTLAALDIFSREAVDVQILEVGLGGRLDAVNIIEPVAAVVVNVALDHEAWLGDNRESIGFEKAGIFRSGIPLIVGESEPPNSIRQRAAQLNNDKLRLYDQHFHIEQAYIEEAHIEEAIEEGWSFTGTTAEGKTICLPDLPKGKLPMPSAACALQVVTELALADYTAIAQGLRVATIPGRCQQVEWRGRHFILDVAHNPAGARYLAQWLSHHVGRNVPVVFSALSDKNHTEVMRELSLQVSEWLVAPLPVPRATDLQNLLLSAAAAGVKAQGFSNIEEALSAACAASQAGDTILVCGSFYTVAEALACFNK